VRESVLAWQRYRGADTLTDKNLAEDMKFNKELFGGV